jgi:cytochrome c-type biogenesis protein CcmH
MIIFSIAAVLLSAIAAALILQRAAGAARRTDADPTLAVYRRQLTEIDDLADRGLLAEGELRAARAEASRRLLTAAQAQTQIQGGGASAVEVQPRPSASKGLRRAVLAGAVIAPLLAVGLYVKLGSPGAPDQPFSRRLKEWTSADPSQLSPSQMAAVLETVVKARPGDAEPLTYLARAQAAAGNLPAAAETMRKAARLQPNDASLWANLGILTMMQSQGQETAVSGDAFRHALTIDPKNAAARYHLARAKVAAGDLNGGLADWRALAADIPAEALERKALEDEIGATAKAGHLVAPAAPKPEPQQQQQAQGGDEAGALAGALTGSAPQTPAGADAQGGPAGAPSGDQKAFIQSMVQRLAERLRQQPNDPAGWARLIRSYAVLGEPDKMKTALDAAHKLFKNQPDALKTVDNAMSAPQGSE